MRRHLDEVPSAQRASRAAAKDGRWHCLVVSVETDVMVSEALLRRVDAVTVPVPDLDEGLRFYGDVLGHQLLWRNDDLGQAGLRLPDSDTEIVLSEHQPYETAWLVLSALEAARVVADAGGQIVEGPLDVPVGTVVIVHDPFGNRLVLLDLSKGTYVTDAEGKVTGVK